MPQDRSRTRFVASALFGCVFASACRPAAEPTDVKAAAFDDPAVAVCEWVVKNYDGTPGIESYKRISASVDHREVHLEFETSALNTAPVRATRDCAFRLQNDGFVFDDPPPSPANCDAELAAYKKSWAPQVSEALEDCRQRLEAELDRLSRILAFRDFPLIQTGIYPIPAERTKLAP